ncbi:MAG TPA: hypothetical protein VG142_04745 [Trebonia sp.]|jgi:hypothetical protein|nr:hypothetical protein [Trebonia sp.]
MRINRTIIARAVLTLGAVGSVMAGTVAPIWAAANSTTAVTASSSASPNWFVNG